MQQTIRFNQPFSLTATPGWRQMRVILLFMIVVVPLLVAIRPRPVVSSTDTTTDTRTVEPVPITVTEPEPVVPEPALLVEVEPVPSDLISPIFTPEVQHWAERIVGWANEFGLDPNMVATIMQIESCGNPVAISSAGARGLFQVMPFHFTAGEDMLDPDTNARRGMAYLVERLEQTQGDTGRAFAGYNGGHVAAGGNWNTWVNETQRYYIWSTGIYQDTLDNNATSQTLQEWLTAGGTSLCQQASRQLNLNQ